MHTNDPVETFYHVDEFCKLLSSIENQFSLPNKKNNIKKAGVKSLLSRSEVMTIKIMFYSSGFKTFKDFYCRSLNDLKSYFKNIVSYNRIIELINAQATALMIF